MTTFFRIVIHTLTDLRRGLVGWAIGVVALVTAFSSFYPSIRQMPDMAAFIDQYPEGLRELFNLTDFGSGQGYLNVEVFSILLPLVFGTFAISRGARLVGGSEEDGTLEVVLSTPVARGALLAARGLALVVAASLLGVVTFVSLLIASAVFDMGVPAGDLAAATTAVVLLGCTYGLVALSVGAITGRRSVALAVAGVGAAAGYVSLVLSRMVDALAGWEVLSPFHHALRDGPLGTGWAVGNLALLVAVGLAALLVAIPFFDRRDIHG